LVLFLQLGLQGANRIPLRSKNITFAMQKYHS
jgi:hypothetical protein